MLVSHSATNTLYLSTHTSAGELRLFSNMYIPLDPTSKSNRMKEEGGPLHEVMIKLANTTTLRWAREMVTLKS